MMARCTGAALSCLVMLCACADRTSGGSGAANADTATRSAQATSPGVEPEPVLRGPFGGIGRRAPAADVRAWDRDANPAGAGLPAGSGSYARGAALYAAQCASCHGTRGEGIAPNPKLVGREPTDFSFAADYRTPKTIGNYWPYATTVYDYINRAMPFTAPGSLKPADVYSLTAFLLAENGIIDTSAILDARTLPQVRMPARGRFVRDDRAGGTAFK